eukprot:2531452-Prymnesium_polylepis.2
MNASSVVSSTCSPVCERVCEMHMKSCSLVSMAMIVRIATPLVEHEPRVPPTMSSCSSWSVVSST